MRVRRRAIFDALRVTSQFDASHVDKLRSAEVEDKAHPKPAKELGHGALRSTAGIILSKDPSVLGCGSIQRRRRTGVIGISVQTEESPEFGPFCPTRHGPPRMMYVSPPLPTHPHAGMETLGLVVYEPSVQR